MSRVVLPLAAIAVGLLAACSSGDGAAGSPEGSVATASGDLGTSTPSPTREPAPVDLSDYDRPLTSDEGLAAEFLTERFFDLEVRIRSIDLSDLRAGGPPKDGIAALRGAGVNFVAAAEADEWLDDEEPVIALEVNGEARAYPLQILIWHEIANDVIGGVPVVVTFCPLCNTAIVLDARVDGEPREFRVSGLLRHSDLVMYDREEESLWQQVTGEAIVGVHTGKRLTLLPSQIVAWGDFKEAFPGARVLSRDTGHSRDYGRNPYVGYDRVGSRTLFPVDFDDGRLDAKERVLTVELNGEAVAFPFSALSARVVIEAVVGGEAIVAFWQPGALSALDADFIIGSRNVGSAGAFSPLIGSERLTFEGRDGAIVDAGTGSTWSVLGRAISGPLQGRALEGVVSGNHFWFAWSIFEPQTRVVTGSRE